MQALYTKKTDCEPINVFLIGNNPIELSSIYEKLRAIKNRSYHAEIGFDLSGIYKKIMKFNPKCIVIDDNLETSYLKKLVNKLSTNSKTKSIPITIIKNSNYSGATNLVGVQDFILKDGITAESLSQSILNSIKLKPMQAYLYLSYKNGRSRLLDFFQ